MKLDTTTPMDQPLSQHKEMSNTSTLKSTSDSKTHRGFERYISKTFKKCISGINNTENVKKPSRYALSSPTNIAIDELCKQLLYTVLTQWQTYADQNQKNFLSDVDIARIISEMWKSTPQSTDAVSGWQLQLYAREAIESYKNSIKEDKALSKAAQLTPTMPTGSRESTL